MISTNAIDWQWSAEYTWLAVSDKCADAADFLTNTLQLQMGDSLAICTHNSENLVALIQSAVRLGIYLIFYNPHLNDEHICDQLTSSPGKICISDREIPWHGRITTLPRFIPQQQFKWHAFDFPDIEADAVAIPSSGSSGTSKHVVLSYRALFHSALSTNKHLQIRNDEHWLICLPVFHVGGLSIIFRAAASGARLSIHQTFSAEAVHQCLNTETISAVSFVPTMLHRLLKLRDDSSWPEQLRCIIIGGARVNQQDLERSAQLGCRPLCSYGLSEFASQVATQIPPCAHSDTCGPVLDGYDIRIDEQSHINIRSRAAFSAYLIDGQRVHPHNCTDWFQTQDCGRLTDHGELIINGRHDDIIIRGGENISLQQIELQIDALQICEYICVLAQDDNEWGQVPVLCYQGTQSPTALLHILQERLESIFCPVNCMQFDDMPLLANGKIDKQRLLQRLTSA